MRLLCAVVLLASIACSRDVLGPEEPASIALELPFPAVVLNDTLRDSLGLARPVRGRAFNFRGETLDDIGFRYLALDGGVRIDTASGVVVGESLRATPVRIVAALGDLQTPPRQLAVVPRPDSLAALVAVDTLRYSLVDTALNVSQMLSVRLFNVDGTATPVNSWIVTFAIVSPTDTLLATLIGDGTAPSRADTTAVDGTAGRRVSVRPARLAASSDSVVVMARARYRGADVRDSPRRLVVHLRPRGQ